VSRQARIPFVLEVNSPLVDEVSRTRGLAFPGWARRKETATLRAAAVLCVVSGSLREWAAGLGVERDRILLTPNGVDLARFFPGAKDERLVRDLDIGGRVVVGFTGFVREWHRLDVALDAFAARGLDRQGGVFLIVGDGPALEGLRAHAARLGIERAVRFTGMIPHARVADYVRLLDVALVTAINPYASPLKLFEYLAVGAACVVADQPNLREILTPDAARFVPAGDPGRLGEVLTALVQSAEARAAVGRAGLALLTERDYTWDGNARRVVGAVLERAAAGARA
jgi:glycosyltransferase involved in cell wall biosynthesis